MNRRRAWIAAQLLFVVALVLFLGFALRDTWADAGPRLRDADPRDLLIATALIAAYYCLFVVGWQWILRALDIRVSYAVALQSEMASMLAKYVPGGIWTPAARVVWLRKAGVDAATPLVLSSILLEAGLSAISGVGVFVAGIAIIGGADAPLLPLILFTAVVTVALHPRIFRWLAARVFRPFGGVDLPELPVPRADRTARLLRVLLDRRRRRFPLHHSRARRRRRPRDDRLPRGNRRGRRDRGGAVDHRAVGARRPRGRDVRARPCSGAERHRARARSS